MSEFLRPPYGTSERRQSTEGIDDSFVPGPNSKSHGELTLKWPQNKLQNASSHHVWCVYSADDPKGGKWDIWRNRVLHSGYVSAWKVDIDYICAKPDGVTINGREGWWKLGQGGSFYLANDTRSPKNLILVAVGGISKSIRFYQDWAKGKDSEKEIAAQIAEWESVRDYAAPIE